jgi:hypothetical protein
MSTNVTALRDAVFARALTVQPAGARAWGLARRVQAPTLNAADLPLLQVVMMRERMTPDGDENVGAIRFIAEGTIGVLTVRSFSDPAVLDGSADTDTGNILKTLLEDATFTSPPKNSLFWFEGVTAVENRRELIQQQSEAYLLQASLMITFKYRLIYSPAAPNYLEEIDVQIPPYQGDEQFSARYEVGNINYGIIGPTSGAPFAAAGPFNVMLEAGARFTGAQTITISDNGAGGLFIPTVNGTFTGGTGSFTATPANLALFFRFGYVPVAPGAVTFLASNSQNWNDPPPFAFLAT